MAVIVFGDNEQKAKHEEASHGGRFAAFTLAAFHVLSLTLFDDIFMSYLK